GPPGGELGHLGPEEHGDAAAAHHRFEVAPAGGAVVAEATEDGDVGVVAGRLPFALGELLVRLDERVPHRVVENGGVGLGHAYWATRHRSPDAAWRGGLGVS